VGTIFLKCARTKKNGKAQTKTVRPYIERFTRGDIEQTKEMRIKKKCCHKGGHGSYMTVESRSKRTGSHVRGIRNVMKGS
jgi:hypothetical protein